MFTSLTTHCVSKTLCSIWDLPGAEHASCATAVLMQLLSAPKGQKCAQRCHWSGESRWLACSSEPQEFMLMTDRSNSACCLQLSAASPLGVCCTNAAVLTLSLQESSAAVCHAELLHDITTDASCQQPEENSKAAYLLTTT